MTIRATYSVDDNKCRLYGTGRLDAETWARAKALGFKSAPLQGCIVAPAWGPEREDFLLEFVDEIEDDDMSLVERQEERAERFEEYSEKRQHDADSAYAGMKSIADGIPMGQPILRGHHSQRRAERDRDRIDSGMRKACAMWDRSGYWQQRAERAKRLALYKELPAVRARRIKDLEAKHRKQVRERDDSKAIIALWSSPKLNAENAVKLAGRISSGSFCFPADEYPRPEGVLVYEGRMSIYSALVDGIVNHEQARDLVVAAHQRSIAVMERWIAHYEHRLTYERAMLEESGGIAADRVKPEVGGGVQCWASPRGGWSYVEKVNKVSVTILDPANYGGGLYRRTMPFDKLTAILSKEQVEVLRKSGMVRDLGNDVKRYGFLVLKAGGEDSQAAE